MPLYPPAATVIDASFVCALDAVNLAPAAAWSVTERLRATYTGPACNVRRASDNATADIGFVPGTDRLDETALATFCGTSIGSVTTLYDQSGNGRHLTQATAANQPSIYTGTAAQKDGTNFSMLFSTTAVLSRNDSLGLTGNPAFSIVMLHNAGLAVPSANTLCTLGIESAGNGYNLVATSFFSTFNYEIGSGNTYTAYGVCTKTLSHLIAQHTASANTDQIVFRVNAASSPVAGTAGATATLTNSFSLGNSAAGTNSAGAISTVIVFPSTLTTTQQTLLEAWLEVRRTVGTFAAVAPLATVVPAVKLSGVIPTLGPLDGLAAAAGAYSVAERLRVGYGGYACTVRRASDNTTLDIGFGTDGKLDETALAAFCGASVGSVTTLYDQSGNSRDLTQSTAANQPTIYTGTAVQKDGANAAMLFGNSGYLGRSDALGFSGNPAFTALMLLNLGNSTASEKVLWLLGPNTVTNGLFGGTVSGQYEINVPTGTPSQYGAATSSASYVLMQHAASTTTAQYTIRENGLSKQLTAAGGAYTAALTNTNFYLGGSNNSGFPVGSLSTAVFLPYTLTTAQLAQLEGWLESRRVGTPYAVAVALPAVDLLLPSPLAVPYAATVTLDLARRSDFVIGVMTAAPTVAFTNPVHGRHGYVFMQEDGTGGYSPTFSAPSGWTMKSMSGSTSLTGANVIRVYEYWCANINGTNCIMVTARGAS